MAAGKKNACQTHSLIAFVDESGVLTAPLVQRTWSPRGITPILCQVGRHRTKVSVIAAVVASPQLRTVSLYFRLYPNTNVGKPQFVSFLGQLRRHVRGRLILIWDRLNGHRSREVVRSCKRHRIEVELLPAYAPELNPVEYAWSYLKTKPLANFAPRGLDELTVTTRSSARKMQRQPNIIRSFLRQSPLFF